MCIERVANRVRNGGHDIPTDVIKRRYTKGLSNLVHRYINIADIVTIVDNSCAILKDKVIYAKVENNEYIINDEIWNNILGKVE